MSKTLVPVPQRPKPQQNKSNEERTLDKCFFVHKIKIMSDNMKFTVEETNLMCIYGTDSHNELIKELEEMQEHLQTDEMELKELTSLVLEKL